MLTSSVFLLLLLARKAALTLGSTSSYSSNTERNLSSGINEPCVFRVILAQIEHVDGPKEIEQWQCELQGIDAENNSIKIADIVGLDEDWITSNIESLVSSESTLFAIDAVLEDNVLDFRGSFPVIGYLDDDSLSVAGIIDGARSFFKKDLTKGEKSVLAVWVSAPDGNTTVSPESISDKIFGTYGDPSNVVAQYEACSYNKLRLRPVQDDRAPGGVVSVSISRDVQDADTRLVERDVKDALESIFGSNVKKQIDHILLCLPPGSEFGGEKGWIGYAPILSSYSVYNDYFCNSLSVAMHEIGHNMKAGHSGDLNVTRDFSFYYGDQSGIMGFGYNETSGPFMCFNGHKSWYFGWYEDRLKDLNPSLKGWSGKLVGVADYDQSEGRNVIVRLKSAAEGAVYFVAFNRKTGINNGTMEGGDQVLVTRTYKYFAYFKEGYASFFMPESKLVAKLSAGDKLTIPDFSGKDVVITVNAIDTTVSPGYADISISKKSNLLSLLRRIFSFFNPFD